MHFISQTFFLKFLIGYPEVPETGRVFISRPMIKPCGNYIILIFFFLDRVEYKRFLSFVFYSNLFVLTLLNFYFNPFPSKPWFLRVCSTSLLITLWEKEKLLVTSNFSFTHSLSSSVDELSAIFIKFKIVVCKLLQLER